MAKNYICPTCEDKKELKAHSIFEGAMTVTCPTCLGKGRISSEKFIQFADYLKLNGYSD